MKKALIFGVSGQDGAFLARFLLEKNYRVIGASRGQPRMYLTIYSGCRSGIAWRWCPSPWKTRVR
ncbi:MAG: GDP-mannose 4,6-dehydratase [Desulfotignum sp.]|nr:GDP-mannose 4,6-dehydratase [Desulfotignum sp.]